MTDVTLAQSGSNNGTTSPATPGSLTLTAGNLAVFIVIVAGTSPTIATPASWTLVRKTEQASRSLGMFMLANNAGGATNPSSTLGGTVTGWYAIMLEFPQTGANCGLQGSAVAFATDNPISNIFGNQKVQTIPNLLFIYTIGAQNTNTISTVLSGTAGLNSGETWSSSVQDTSNSQGNQLHTYWASNLAKGPGSWPTNTTTIDAGGFSYEIGAWFNTTASQPSIGAPTGGKSGLYVPNQYQGMTGG